MWIFALQDRFLGGARPILRLYIQDSSCSNFVLPCQAFGINSPRRLFAPCGWTSISAKPICLLHLSVPSLKLTSWQGNFSTAVVIRFCYNVAKVSISLVEKQSNCLDSHFSASALSGAAIRAKLGAKPRNIFHEPKNDFSSVTSCGVLSLVFRPYYEKHSPIDLGVPHVQIKRSFLWITCISSVSASCLLCAAATIRCKHVLNFRLQFVKR